MDDHRDYFIEEDDTPKSSERNISFVDEQSTPQSSGGSMDDSHREDNKKYSRWKRRIAMTIIIVVIALSGLIFIRYFNPYVDDARETGYVVSVERRGIVFKTYEGMMLTPESFSDTTQVYQRDFTFSIPDRQLARRLQEMQGTGQKVTVVYERYYGILPWRGASKIVVTGVLQ